jgi:hypothetical protein
MKNPKSQNPNPKQIPNLNHQLPGTAGLESSVRHWSLKPGASLVLGVWCLVLLSSANAQSYSIDWFTIDGGGGTSTGGVYSVTGTIGQPDAGGPMTGGQYAVTGGFWSLLSVVQTPNAPLLTIRLTSTNTAVIFWPSPSSGFNLQQNTNLSTAIWTAPGEVVNDNGTVKSIVVNPPTGNRSYRLIHSP